VLVVTRLLFGRHPAERATRTSPRSHRRLLALPPRRPAVSTLPPASSTT